VTKAVSSKTVSGLRCRTRRVTTSFWTNARLRPVALLAALLATSCVSHRHSVGLGATGTGEQRARQYYILFGFVKANEVSAQRMSDGVTSYDIESKFGFMDLLLQPLLMPLTMTSRTVTVRT
jgi:hypothetical protein